MKNANKYTRQFFAPPNSNMNWVKKTHIDKSPIWCSVDLRDGNQALPIPMTLDEKIEFFNLLTEIGFKEIEIGFPASNDTEFAFCRELIEKDLIPDDVTIAVLTQCRENIVRKTFDAIDGAKNVIVHFYNSVSPPQREKVFGLDKAQVKQIAISAAMLIKELSEGKNIRFEYSPESFSATEPEYALEVCNAVTEILGDCIINLPATVENSLPHVFANQVEFIKSGLPIGTVLSIHPHNDRGTGVATAEYGILAGADRVEGTLFGNGERTGNVDIVTLALNMFSQGVDPNLDFSNLPHICEVYERLTGMHINPRQPYSGELVFTAFSGSHQDAISKSLRKKSDVWDIPYLPIDPKDIGREYETDIIRINSQSGKGGVGYILSTCYGLELPKQMALEFSGIIKSISAHEHKELSKDEIYTEFENRYVNIETALALKSVHYKQNEDGSIDAIVDVVYNNKAHYVTCSGNGRLDAVSEAVRKVTGVNFDILAYSEHALTVSSKSKAISYVGIAVDGKTFWGAGIHSDIITSSNIALVTAFNTLQGLGPCTPVGGSAPNTPG
jgi:2-isopropylmalate synthase